MKTTWAAVLVAILFIPMIGEAQFDQPPRRNVSRPSHATWKDHFELGGPDDRPHMVYHEWTRAGASQTLGDWLDMNRTKACPIETYNSRVVGLSPSNGSVAWSVALGTYHKLPGPAATNSQSCQKGLHWAPIREEGVWPHPYYGRTPADNVQPVADVTGDGIRDVLGYGWQRETCPDDLEPQEERTWDKCFSGSLVMLNGGNGSVVWSRPFTMRMNLTKTVYHLTGWPTGLLAYHSPVGVRFAWKTTEWYWESLLRSGLTIERVEVADATTGQALWTAAAFVDRTKDASPVNRYLTGAAQLDDEPELEIVWDEHLLAEDYRMNVGALRGRVDVADVELPSIGNLDPQTLLHQLQIRPHPRILWGATSCYAVPHRGSDAKQFLEQDHPVPVQHYARLIDDVTGDNKAEVVCTYLSHVGRVASRNGAWETHVQPISGHDGSRLWPRSDVRQQGYGFVSDVNEPPAFRYEPWGSIPTGADPDVSNPLIALGTSDRRERIAAGADFPAKFTRVTALDARDGTPKWGTQTWEFVQNTFESEDLALSQFATGLATRDFTGDGVRELLGAPVYPDYDPKVQVLFSTTYFRLPILDGRTGETVQWLRPWGPYGQPVVCDPDERGRITIISGFSRRYDVSQFDVLTGTEQWRHAWFFDPVPRAQLAGTEMTDLGSRCGETQSRFGAGQNAHIWYGPTRHSVASSAGVVNASRELEWLVPRLLYAPPPNSTLYPYMFHEAYAPSTDEVVVRAIATLLLSGLVSFGAALVLNLFSRRRQL